METTNKKPIQPYYLPQISCPFTFVKDNLMEMGFHFRPVVVSVGQLKPIQKEVDLQKVERLSKMKNLKTELPIFISQCEKILDGHHRVSALKFSEGPKAKINAIRLLCDEKDGCAVLKIIQDRWEQRNKNN